MQMADEQISDPKADLVAYESQLAEVGRLLLEDPDNEELQAIYADLADVRTAQRLRSTCRHRRAPGTLLKTVCSCHVVDQPPTVVMLQVIQLTRELAEAQAGVPSAGLAVADAPLSSSNAAGEQHEQLAGLAEPAAAAASPTDAAGTLLPPQVAEQIRHAQQRAALGGQGPAAWAVGAKCKALYSGDGNW